jgi:hypothetical protein
MLVQLQRIRGAEQHHGGKHVPLRFRKRIGGGAVPLDEAIQSWDLLEVSAERNQAQEGIAHSCIERADKRGEQHQIDGDYADLLVEGINAAADD